MNLICFSHSIRFRVQTLPNVVHATGGVDSTPCRTHIFLSVVSPRSVSLCTSHFPPAHMCAWLKTCRGCVVWTPAHSSKVILSRHVPSPFDRCSWLFLFLFYFTATEDCHTLTDGNQANQKRYSARGVAVWPSGRMQRSHILYFEMTNHQNQKAGFVEIQRLVLCWKWYPVTIKENTELRLELHHYLKMDLTRGSGSLTDSTNSWETWQKKCESMKTMRTL